MENITHKQLGEEIGKGALEIGRVRKAVCTEEDMEGRLIKPSGILKILDYYEIEMSILEEGKPDVVKVQVLRQPVKNPRWISCIDLDLKKKALVNVPKNRKAILDKPKKILLVERGTEKGRFFYTWKQNLKI